ncbi:hypothetical protein Tco_1193429 [Tanacetum coccineum]
MCQEHWEACIAKRNGDARQKGPSWDVKVVFSDSFGSIGILEITREAIEETVVLFLLVVRDWSIKDVPIRILHKLDKLQIDELDHLPEQEMNLLIPLEKIPYPRKE